VCVCVCVRACVCVCVSQHYETSAVGRPINGAALRPGIDPPANGFAQAL